jgi:ADP-ribose pyrophosphatase YjhB (NUDIX family)
MDELEALAAHDDVRYREETTEVDAETFESICEIDESGIDTSVGALVRDGGGRIGLVRNHWGDGWLVPGGKVEPDETLREAVVREEMGVAVSVDRPLEVTEVEHRNGDDSITGYFVVFEAVADDAGLGDDLGEDGVEIEDAAWFDEVPEECENADLLDRHR